MKNFKISGCGTALVTPFKNGVVDYEAYKNLVIRQVEAGVDYLVPLGTTAETPCLTLKEKVRLLTITKENAAGKKLVVGVGANSPITTIENMEIMGPCGADAFLVVVPYYNTPTQDGLYSYFKAVAEATDKPIFLYNVPGRTGINLSTETTLKLAEIDNIVAVKEASSNYAQIAAILRSRPEGFMVFSGNDDETLSLMATGADGVISVASNIAPAEVTELTHCMLEGNYARAREIYFRLLPLFKNCFVESNPIPAKAALSCMGLCENELRLPLASAQPATCELMEKTVRELGLLK